MKRMSRAGRCEAMKQVLKKQWRKNPRTKLTIGQIANRMGLKSSTKLKNWLCEYAFFDDEIIVNREPNVVKFYFRPYVQTAFDQREISINGSRRVVADWIKDLVAGVQ